MTTEHTTTAAEANIFATNPDGFKVHFKLIAESPNKAIEGINALGGWLKQHGYSPDASMGGASAAPAPPSNGGVPAPAPHCPDCGGEVYDNRGNRPSPKSPHFKCKNKSCGSVGWEGSDGVSWQKARQPANSGQRY